MFLADLGAPVGHEQSLRRPVVLLSVQPWLDSNPSVVTVLPITRTYRGRSTHVEIEPGTSGLSAVSYIRCEDVRGISPLRLEHRFGRADEIALLKIELVLRRLLAL